MHGLPLRDWEAEWWHRTSCTTRR